MQNTSLRLATPFNPNNFLLLYEQFIRQDFIGVESNGSLSLEAGRHSNITTLKYPQKGWSEIVGWVAIRDRDFPTPSGVKFQVLVGDTVRAGHEYGKIMTRFPAIEVGLEDLILQFRTEGIFVPIYDRVVFSRFTKMGLEARIAWNMQQLRMPYDI